jgi:hypothetical protein
MYLRQSLSQLFWVSWQAISFITSFMILYPQQYPRECSAPRTRCDSIQLVGRAATQSVPIASASLTVKKLKKLLRMGLVTEVLRYQRLHGDILPEDPMIDCMEMPRSSMNSRYRFERGEILLRRQQAFRSAIFGDKRRATNLYIRIFILRPRIFDARYNDEKVVIKLRVRNHPRIQQRWS